MIGLLIGILVLQIISSLWLSYGVAVLSKNQEAIGEKLIKMENLNSKEHKRYK